MNRRLYLFFLFSIATLVYYIERFYMFSTDGSVEKDNNNLTLYVGLLLLLLLFVVFLSNNKINTERLSKRFTNLSIYIYGISIFYSLFYPFAGRNEYGIIILPLLLFYFSNITTLSAKAETTIVWTMTIVFVLLTFFYLSKFYNNDFTIDLITDASYPILYLLPFLLCHKKNFIRIIAIITTLIVVMLSLKRGGFLAFVVAVMVYLLMIRKTTNKRHLPFWRILLIIGIPIILYIVYSYISDNVIDNQIVVRFEEDDTGGSGRIHIYKDYWEMITNSNLLFLLFGHGWLGSMRDSGINLTCHNDFLEAVVDFGLIGFVLFITFIIELIKLCKKMVQNKNVYAPALGASIAMLLVNSMVSHILIYPHFLILFSLFWGFVSGAYKHSTLIEKT